MRVTVDGAKVVESEYVYEILYRYYNREVSLAEPHSIRMKNVPKEFPIWKDYYRCKKQCDRINQQITNL